MNNDQVCDDDDEHDEDEWPDDERYSSLCASSIASLFTLFFVISHKPEYSSLDAFCILHASSSSVSSRVIVREGERERVGVLIYFVTDSFYSCFNCFSYSQLLRWRLC